MGRPRVLSETLRAVLCKKTNREGVTSMRCYKLAAIMVFVFAMTFPCTAFAHSQQDGPSGNGLSAGGASLHACGWDDGWYDSNNDGYSHTYTYYDDYNYDKHSYTGSCTWEYWNCTYDQYGVSGHCCVYECPYCHGEKSEYEDCSWERDDVYYENYSNKKHKVIKYYSCSECGNGKRTVSKKKHKYHWIRYGNNFYYECNCGKAPKYNGVSLYDSNDSDNICLCRNGTYRYEMYHYNKTRNKVKSIKYSKKKICSVKRSGDTLIVKAKKKGKCNVSVKMKSGAKYLLKVRVK